MKPSSGIPMNANASGSPGAAGSKQPKDNGSVRGSLLSGKSSGELGVGTGRANKSREGAPMQMQKSLYGSQMIGSKIAKLQDTGNFYAKKIERDTQKLEAIEKEIEKTEKVLQEKRKDMMTKKKTMADSDPAVLQKKIKSMHLKLGFLKKKYNESLASNEEFKEQINHLRREKNIFDNIYVELKAELAEKKEQLKKVLTESRIAKQEIQKGEERLSKYREEADIDRKKFEMEFQSVYNALPEADARDEKLKEKFLLGSKQQLSSHDERNNSPFDRSAYDFENFRIMNGGLGAAGLQAIKKDKAKRNQQKENQHLEGLKAEVSQYEEIFKKLLEETGTQDISNIVKTFVDYETENYSLFKFINTLRDETEKLTNQKKNLQEQINMYKNKPSEYRQEPKTIKFMELKKEIEIIEEKKQKHLKKQEDVQSQLGELKQSIVAMFSQIGCASSEYTADIPKTKGQLQPIEESNMLVYLAAIERRTNDLLQVYSDLYKQKQLGDPKSRLGEESNINNNNMSNSHIAQKAIKFDDLDLVLDPLRDEFKINYEKVKEEKRNKEYQLVSEITKEKNFLDLKELQENAKNEFKKMQNKVKAPKKK